jgi:hypothetical protein
MIMSTRMRQAEHVARMVENINAHKILRESQKERGRLRGRLEDNIKIDLREVGCHKIYGNS